MVHFGNSLVEEDIQVVPFAPDENTGRLFGDRPTERLHGFLLVNPSKNISGSSLAAPADAGNERASAGPIPAGAPFFIKSHRECRFLNMGSLVLIYRLSVY